MNKQPMGPMEALNLALSKEKDSIALYKRLELLYPAAKDTFLLLQNEEYKHKKLLEKLIVEFRK